jgi:hypothetical protein
MLLTAGTKGPLGSADSGANFGQMHGLVAIRRQHFLEAIDDRRMLSPS